MAEAVYMQHLMGVEGVIVDLVQEITEAMAEMIKPPVKAKAEATGTTGEEGKEEEGKVKEEEEMDRKPQFSERELSFLMKLIPQLIDF